MAEQYDRVRPSYPAQLIADVVGLAPGSRVVEVGAGTGKATVLFAQHDVELTCLEPDPGMAAVLRTKVAGLNRVHVVASTFEAWEYPDQPFDALVSAQAWHWTDDRRWDRAARVLRPGGLLAVWWNVETRDNGVLERAIAAAYEANGVRSEDSPLWTAMWQKEWPGNEFSAHPDFQYLGLRVYPAPQTYSAQEFTDFLDTSSHHRVLTDETRERLSADIRVAIDAHGGKIGVDRSAHLYLGRRR